MEPLGRTLRRLDGWYLAPAPATRLAALRILVVGYCLVFALVRTPYWLDVARLPEHRYEAVGVLTPLDAPLPVGLVATFAGITAVALALGLAGVRWAVSGPVGAIGMLVLTTHGNSWQQVFHTENLPVLHLVVLAAAPAAAAWSRDARRDDADGPPDAPRFGWPIRAMAVVTVTTYVLAGVAKLRVGGVAWLTDEALRNHIAYDNLRKELLGDLSSPVAPWALRQTWLFGPVALVTLVVELGAPLALFGGRLRTLWVSAAWGFHLGVLVLMAILFPYPLLGIAYAPLFRVERLAPGGRFAKRLRIWKHHHRMVERSETPQVSPRPLEASRGRRLGSRLLAIALVLAVLLPAGTSGADRLDDLRAERDRVQSERAQAAAQVDASQAEVTDLTAALDELNTLIAQQAAEVDAARAAVVAAEAALAETEAQIVAAEAEIAATRDDLRRIAVDSFVGRNSDAEADLALFQASELSEGVRARAYLDFGSGNLGDLLDQLRALEADLEDLAEQRRVQLEESEAARAAEEEQLAQLEEALTLQQQLVAEAESRLEHMLSEAESLAALDNQLAGQIQQEEARIRAAIEAERRRREELARRQAASSTTGGSGSSGSSGSGGSVTRPPIPPSSEIVSVNGILIHTSAADELRALLDAAAADGIILGGGGWRSSDTQVELRKAHCGTSEYAIWEAHPNECSPPTARPGQSMHERGLAVDFTVNGRAIRSRDSDAFRWLAANAPSYGFRNLPSEPWHWSTNGQ